MGWHGHFKTYDQDDPLPQTQLKRCQAGTAILWHGDIDKYVETIEDGSDRITGIRLLSQNSTILLLCVCMPTSGAPADSYKGKLTEIMHKYNDHAIIIVGDMHGSLHRTPLNAYDVILKSFMEENDTVLPLGDQYPSEPTFAPSYRSSRSTIDYAFVSEVDAQIITAVDILDLYSCDSPHRAVSLKVMFSMCNDKKLPNKRQRPRWSTIVEKSGPRTVRE